MRGDRYRDALTAIASVERVRDLKPELLSPATSNRSKAPTSSSRAHPAARRHPIHPRPDRRRDERRQRRPTLMREIALPPEYEVGQGYGKVSWDVRADLGELFGLVSSASTTELYPVGFDAVTAEWSNWPAPTHWWTGHGRTWPRAAQCTPSTSPSLFTPVIRVRVKSSCRARKPAGGYHELLGKSLAVNKEDRRKEFMDALRPEDFYHTGIVVPDLDAAMARLTALAGYRWINPLSYTLPFRTADGNSRIDLHHRLLRAEPAHRACQRGPRNPVDGYARQRRPPRRLFHRQPRRNRADVGGQRFLAWK